MDMKFWIINSVLSSFIAALYVYYKEAKSLSATSSCMNAHQAAFSMKTSGESCQAVWEDETPCSKTSHLSHDSGEITRQKSLLAKPCISFESFMYTNCYNLPNLASMYMGGKISPSTDTVPFVPPFSKCGMFGCNNDVNNIIKPEIPVPGKNWRFTGQNGNLLIRLPVMTFITAITIIHPPRKQLPEGFSRSAPKDFCVHGLNPHQGNFPLSLGCFAYNINGIPAQTFPIQTSSYTARKEKTLAFMYIEVVFRNNHGNPKYTAIYKIEIHGVPTVQLN